MSDCLVIGGGVIGLSIAYELSRHGAKVTVLEQGQFGREASWAGAGILPPGNPEAAADPRSLLRAHSHVLWPRLNRQLHEETGIDNGYVRCGGLEVAFGEASQGESSRHAPRAVADRVPVNDTAAQTVEWDEPAKADGTRSVPATLLHDEAAALRAEGVEVAEVTAVELKELEPALSGEITAAFRLPQLGQVRNPRHLKALVTACRGRGVDLRKGESVTSIEAETARVACVRTAAGRYTAESYCVAGGAWSRSLLAPLGVDLPIVPVRGQIVLLSMTPPPFRHVISVGSCYLVPRADGRILIGSTEESVGFDKGTTAAAIAGLIEFGMRVVPVLAEAHLERAWAGLRPGSPDSLPYLGRAPGYDNLFVAAGHFRSGLQTSPATAVVLRQLILGEDLLFPLEAFSCQRARM